MGRPECGRSWPVPATSPQFFSHGPPIPVRTRTPFCVCTSHPVVTCTQFSKKGMFACENATTFSLTLKEIKDVTFRVVSSSPGRRRMLAQTFLADAKVALSGSGHEASQRLELVTSGCH